MFLFFNYYKTVALLSVLAASSSSSLFSSSSVFASALRHQVSSSDQEQPEASSFPLTRNNVERRLNNGDALWVLLGGDALGGENNRDESGGAVSVNAAGNRVAIGSVNNIHGDNNQSGHVRVYSYNGNSWTQLGGDIDGEKNQDYFGCSVALDAVGDTIVIGGYRNDVTNGNLPGGSNAGHARVYKYDGVSNWQQLGEDIDGAEAGLRLGYSVDINAAGTRVAIGAPGSGDSSVPGSITQIYDWDGTAWKLVGGNIKGEVFGDQSGSSVSLSNDGMRVAIGAPNNDQNGDNAGHVRVFEQANTTTTDPVTNVTTTTVEWVQLGQDVEGLEDFDFFGFSVAISGDGTRFVGGGVESEGGSGLVQVYQYEATATPPAWVQVGSDIDGEDAGDLMGFSVSINDDGTRIAIGSPANDGERRYFNLQGPIQDIRRRTVGGVKVFEWTGSSWQQVGRDVNGARREDRSGYSVSMNAAGNIVAIGSPRSNDGGETFIGGRDAGSVRIFEFTSRPTPANIFRRIQFFFKDLCPVWMCTAN